MTKPIMLIAALPFFPGFYESRLSAMVDHAEEMHCYNIIEDGSNEGDEPQFHANLQLDENEISSILYDVTDYKKAYLTIAQDYAQAFDAVAGDAFDLSVKDKRKVYDFESGKYVSEKYMRPSIRATFESMDSPREYNFTTDRLYVNFPLCVARLIMRMSKAEKHATLQSVIDERHTSRSGFISFYRTDVKEWLSKPLTEWDHNELGTLIVAGLKIAGSDPDSDDFTNAIYEALGDECGDSAWSDAVDWNKYETKKLEKRAEKLAQWIASDCESFKAWRYEKDALFNDIIKAAPDEFNDFPHISDLPFRCPNTPDMLEGMSAK